MRRAARLAGGALALVLLLPGVALAHAGEPLAPHDAWRAWSWPPTIVLPLLLTGALYLAGVRALWRAAGAGRGVRRAEAAAFAAGWLTLFIALLSPIHEMGEALLSAHMVQHELLMAIAAPLLVLGRPLVAWLWAVPPAWRRALGRAAAAPAVAGPWHAISAPLAATALHGVAIWLWHAPALYQLSLRNEWVHAAQHASFLFTALLFWWAVLGHARGAAIGTSVLCLFVTALHSGGLGALLTFATRLWYPAYAATTPAWGMSPLEDQQLAGLIMWIPGGIAYLVAALALFGSLLTAEPQASSVDGTAAAPRIVEDR